MERPYLRQEHWRKNSQWCRSAAPGVFYLHGLAAERTQRPWAALGYLPGVFGGFASVRQPWLVVWPLCMRLWRLPHARPALLTRARCFGLCRMGLDRRHAQIALDDTEVAGVFKEECFSTWDDGWYAAQACQK